MRPATDAMRQAVFSSLGGRVVDARFLDLFAGSGAYGLEAFSRGAIGGTFVEKDARTVPFIRRNIAAVGKSVGRAIDELRVVTADAATVALSEVPDLVFIDPPYEIIEQIAARLFERLSELTADRPDVLVIFEMPGQLELVPAGWTCIKRLGKGMRQPTAAIFRSNQTGP